MASAAEYGGFWIRFLAYLADCAILFALIIVLALAFGATGMVLVGNIVIFLLQLLYWPLMQCSARQATFGKAMLGLKVVGSEDNRISFLRSLARELAKIISSLTLMIGFVMAAFTGRKQALHDLIASTTVVRAGEARIGRALAVSAAGFVVPVIAIAVFGAGIFGSMLGAGMQDMEAMRREAEKQQAEAMRKAAPPPVAAKPAAPAPSVAPAPAAAPTLAPVAAAPQPVARPKPEAASAPAPAPKPIAEPAPQPKPEPVEVAAVRPAPRLAAPPPEPPRVERSAAASRLSALPEAPPLPGPERSPSSTSTLKYNDLSSAILGRDPAAVETLLRMGKWPDKPDSQGVTPLMLAAQNGDLRSTELLLKAGANPNLSLRGETAATIARQRGEFAIVDLLQRHGAR